MRLSGFAAAQAYFFRLLLVFGSWRLPVHAGYLTQLRNFPYLPRRSTSQPSLHSGQTGNVAPQLHVSWFGLVESFVGKSWPHALHGFIVSPHSRPCSQLKNVRPFFVVCANIRPPHCPQRCSAIPEVPSWRSSYAGSAINSHTNTEGF